MTPAARSTLDIALWFQSRSDSAGDRLSQRRLHFLLYLAQALYAGDNDGAKLMPATFLAAEAGPLEPNIYQFFQDGTPPIAPGTIGKAVENFLDEVWTRFGRQPVAELERFVYRDGAWAMALKRGRNSEITMESIVANYHGTRALGSTPTRQAAAQSRSPGKEYWTPGGKRAKKWVPGVSGNPPARIRADEPAPNPRQQGSGIRGIIPAPARETGATRAGRPAGDGDTQNGPDRSR